MALSNLQLGLIVFAAIAIVVLIYFVFFAKKHTTFRAGCSDLDSGGNPEQTGCTYSAMARPWLICEDNTGSYLCGGYNKKGDSTYEARIRNESGEFKDVKCADICLDDGAYKIESWMILPDDNYCYGGLC